MTILHESHHLKNDKKFSMQNSTCRFFRQQQSEVFLRQKKSAQTVPLTRREQFQKSSTLSLIRKKLQNVSLFRKSLDWMFWFMESLNATTWLNILEVSLTDIYLLRMRGFKVMEHAALNRRLSGAM